MKHIAILFVLSMLFFATGCNGVISVSQSTGVTPTTTPSVITTFSTPIATSLKPILFDFDTGSSMPGRSQSTPFEYIREGLIAHFSSPSDPSAFSIQNSESTSLVLSQFSGNYLMQNFQGQSPLIIKFNRRLTGIKLSFATADYHGPANIEVPSDLKLTAFLDSLDNSPVSTTISHGNYTTDSFPQGTLSFQNDASPFNIIRLDLLFQPGGAAAFLVDNIQVYLQAE